MTRHYIGCNNAGAALFLVLYIPLTLVFWHAPALVVWHGMAPCQEFVLQR